MDAAAAVSPARRCASPETPEPQAPPPPPSEFSMVDDLLFHDAAAALALPGAQLESGAARPEGEDDAFVASLLRLEDDAPASADDLEVALLAGDMLLDADANILALYGAGDLRRSLGGADDDAATDVASEASSPPPAFSDKAPSPPPASPAQAPAQTPTSRRPYSPPRTLAPLLPALATDEPQGRSAASPVQKMEPLAAPALRPGSLPYALPVALFAPATLNSNQKRPLADVLPGGLGGARADAKGSAAAASDDHSAKKSKREIRQMKNRESANKSRLRRKAQLGELTTEVTELKKKEQALQMVIAGLRAENKALQGQNSFLQSLVTSFQRDGRLADAAGPPQLAQHKHMAVYDHHPPASAHANFIALPVLDAQEHSCQDGGTDAQLLDSRSTKRKRSLASLSTASAATLTMCASVFGITLLADYDGGYASTGSVRHSGRVLHEVSPQTSPALGPGGCSPDHGPLSLALVWTKLLAAWEFVATSDLARGMLLNALSFALILAVYHWWQRSSAAAAKGQSSRGRRCGHHGRPGRLRRRACGHSTGWHAASLDCDASDDDCASS